MDENSFNNINLPKSPKFMKDRKTGISLKISDSMLAALDDVSDYYGMPRTTLINYVLDL